MAIRIPWLVDAARFAAAGTGKQVIVSPGWETRGQGGLRLLGLVIGHHTGTPNTAPGDYPSRNVVTNGRAGLMGLLSQLGLGRSGNIYVMGNGLAWHAGASAYGGYFDLNDESVGIEAESAGDGHWTADQLFMYPRLVGAVLHYMRRGADHYASHRTVARPAGRKPDPAGISDDWMRRRALEFLAAPVPPVVKPKVEDDDEMSLTVYVVGDAYPDVYCCTFDGREPGSKRITTGAEYAIVEAVGKHAVRVSQKHLDAIPLAEG